MSKEDLRIKRTYHLLSDALFSLMREKPFEKISVVEICERAMVHRATFYTHFEDKYALLRYCMSRFSDFFDNETVTSHDIAGYQKYCTDVASNLISELAKNQALYKTLIRKNKDDSLLANIRFEIIKRIEEKLEGCETNGLSFKIPTHVLSQFYGGASMSVIEWWLENDMPIPPEEIVGYIQIILNTNIINED